MSNNRSQIWTASNVLSLLRIPLAFVFLSPHPLVRATTLVLAMITDCLDGYLARRSGKVTQLGAFLDPFTDKFFVLFVGSVLLHEQSLKSWQLIALISRDFSVLIFGFILVLTGTLGRVHFQSIFSGKITTAIQFLVLIGMSLGATPPLWIFRLFIVLAGLALIELFVIHRYALKAKAA